MNLLLDLEIIDKTFNFSFFQPKQSTFNSYRQSTELKRKGVKYWLLLYRCKVCSVLLLQLIPFSEWVQQSYHRLIVSYHNYWRCRIHWLSARNQQTGRFWVVISFNSFWIAQRCVLWKLCTVRVCMHECDWGYEAAPLFPDQLLVTQEWLICNGCCHSPAVAPSDGYAVTNSHTHSLLSVRTPTRYRSSKHTNVCTGTGILAHEESSICLIVLGLLTISPSTCHQSACDV